MAIYKISSSRVNNIEATEYVGSTNELGLIWYDEITGFLRLYNGEPGGTIINGASNISGSEISNETSNVKVYPNGPVTVSVNGVSNVVVFDQNLSQFSTITATGNVVAAGNISAQYYTGNGSQLTGIVATDVGILDSLSVIGNITSGNINNNGNINSENVSATGNVSATFFIGDGSKLTGITAQGLPTQAGNATFFLTTDGANVLWNHPLAYSLTFTGGMSASDEFNSSLDGGGADADYTNSVNILGGAADSSYDFTLSAVALTGQYEDIDDKPTEVGIPLTSTSPGTTGQVTFDSNWLYVCVDTNTWRRAALNSW